MKTLTPNQTSRRIQRIHKQHIKDFDKSDSINNVIDLVNLIHESVTLVKTKPDFIVVNNDVGDKIESYLEYYEQLQMTSSMVGYDAYNVLRINGIGIVQMDVAKAFQLRYSDPALQTEYLKYLEQL